MTNALNTSQNALLKSKEAYKTPPIHLSKIILWNNKAICVDGKSVYYNRLANIGILKLGDLIYEDNKLLTNHLRELNISPLDAFRLLCN